MLSHRLGPALASVGLGCGILISAPIARDVYSGFAGMGRRVSAAATAPAPRLPEGELVARLTVSRLALDAPVFEGVEAGTLAKGPGHVPGTALPGDERAALPSLIAIPRGRNGNAIARLRLGDRVRLTSPAGLRRYRVVERRVQEPAQVRLGAASSARVTLITPFPPDFPGPAPMRLAVALEGRD
ncbi:MAG TPA: sortase [Thermoanaerobaculia bacterium]|nr:sortase [Thermoanaerobaculia bacterium]